MYELKIYRGVLCHDIAEWCKIWRGIDLSFENSHEEFDKFWLEHSKVSKMFTLMGSFWAKYILFELEKYRRVIFHDTEKWRKIWRGNDLPFQNSLEEFVKLWPKHSKVSNLHFNGPLWGRYILFEVEKYRQVSFVTLKSDAKSGEE